MFIFINICVCWYKRKKKTIPHSEPTTVFNQHATDSKQNDEVGERRTTMMCAAMNQGKENIATNNTGINPTVWYEVAPDEIELHRSPTYEYIPSNNLGNYQTLYGDKKHSCPQNYLQLSS